MAWRKQGEGPQELHLLNGVAASFVEQTSMGLSPRGAPSLGVCRLFVEGGVFSWLVERHPHNQEGMQLLNGILTMAIYIYGSSNVATVT